MDQVTTTLTPAVIGRSSSPAFHSRSKTILHLWSPVVRTRFDVLSFSISPIKSSVYLLSNSGSRISWYSCIDCSRKSYGRVVDSFSRAIERVNNQLQSVLCESYGSPCLSQTERAIDAIASAICLASSSEGGCIVCKNREKPCFSLNASSMSKLTMCFW